MNKAFRSFNLSGWRRTVIGIFTVAFIMRGTFVLVLKDGFYFPVGRGKSGLRWHSDLRERQCLVAKQSKAFGSYQASQGSRMSSRPVPSPVTPCGNHGG
jgi:hypothetical protein